MSVESNRSAVRAYFDAVGRGDRAALLALFRPDLRWRVPKGAVPPYAGVHHGAERVVDLMLGAVGAAFVPGSQRVAVRLMLAEGDVVMFAQLLGTPPTLATLPLLERDQHEQSVVHALAPEAPLPEHAHLVLARGEGRGAPHDEHRELGPGLPLELGEERLEPGAGGLVEPARVIVDESDRGGNRGPVGRGGGRLLRARHRSRVQRTREQQGKDVTRSSARVTAVRARKVEWSPVAVARRGAPAAHGTRISSIAFTRRSTSTRNRR